MTFFRPMMLRNRSFQQATTLFTGIIFLNMSFFLAEISALKLDKNQKLMENMAKLFAGAASEEEKDIFGGPSEDLKTTSEIDFLLNSEDLSDRYYVIVSVQIHRIVDGAKPTPGMQEIVVPPPQV